MKPLCNAGLLFPSDSAIKMHPYRAQALMGNKQNMKFFHPLSMLGNLARAMLYLVSFYRSLTHRIDGAHKMNRLQDHIQHATHILIN